MKQVLPNVDTVMMNRVKSWVLGRRDGSGSFRMNDHGLDSFGSPPEDLSDAYILWVLTSIGEDVAGLQKEIEKLISNAKSSEDSYLVALTALVL